MTQQQIDAIVTGLLEQGVIDQNWLENPCKIPCSKPLQPRMALLWHWLTVATFIAVAALTLALVAYVAINGGEL